MGDVRDARSGAQEAIPVVTIATDDTNKVAVSRVEAADMFRPTVQMPPLFPDDGEAAARSEIRTKLGVAPLEPATVVRAPFVVDVPVPRRSLLPKLPLVPTAVLARHDHTPTVRIARLSRKPHRRGWRVLVARLVQLVHKARRWQQQRRRTDVLPPLAR